MTPRTLQIRDLLSLFGTPSHYVLPSFSSPLPPTEYNIYPFLCCLFQSVCIRPCMLASSSSPLLHCLSHSLCLHVRPVVSPLYVPLFSPTSGCFPRLLILHPLLYLLFILLSSSSSTLALSNLFSIFYLYFSSSSFSTLAGPGDEPDSAAESAAAASSIPPCFPDFIIPYRIIGFSCFFWFRRKDGNWIPAWRSLDSRLTSFSNGWTGLLLGTDANPNCDISRNCVLNELLFRIALFSQLAALL